VLRALAQAHRHLAELKSRAALIPNQGILIDKRAMLETKASSKIEHIVTTQDKLFQACAFPDTPSSPVAKQESGQLLRRSATSPRQDARRSADVAAPIAYNAHRHDRNRSYPTTVANRSGKASCSRSGSALRLYGSARTQTKVEYSTCRHVDVLTCRFVDPPIWFHSETLSRRNVEVSTARFVEGIELEAMLSKPPSRVSYRHSHTASQPANMSTWAIFGPAIFEPPNAKRTRTATLSARADAFR